MNQSYLDYINILKSFIHSDKPMLSAEPDWPTIIKLAQINATLGIVGYIAMLNPGLVESELHAHLRKQCLAEIAIYSRRAEQMKVLVEEMNKQEMDHLLFKGYIVRDYYTVPELRTFSDIDFVIKKQDREKSHALMCELGFKLSCEFEPVLSYLKSTEYYEIHTDVMEVDVSDKADYKGYYQHIWEHVVNVSEHTYEFTPEYHFLYLLTHMAKHISSSGAGIRMYLDIAFFIKHFGNDIDWKWISKELEVLAFVDYANIVLSAIESWFGIKSPLPLRTVEEEIMDDYLVFTLEGGTYGHYGRTESTIFLKNQNRNNTESVSKLATMWKRLFPPAEEIKYRYPYIQSRKWLLPIAWVHRFYRGTKRFGYHMHQAKDIIKGENKEVLRLRRMYKEIGL